MSRVVIVAVLIGLLVVLLAVLFVTYKFFSAVDDMEQVQNEMKDR